MQHLISLRAPASRSELWLIWELSCNCLHEWLKRWNSGCQVLFQVSSAILLLGTLTWHRCRAGHSLPQKAPCGEWQSLRSPSLLVDLPQLFLAFHRTVCIGKRVFPCFQSSSLRRPSLCLNTLHKRSWCSSRSRIECSWSRTLSSRSSSPCIRQSRRRARSALSCLYLLPNRVACDHGHFSFQYHIPKLRNTLAQRGLHRLKQPDARKCYHAYRFLRGSSLLLAKSTRPCNVLCNWPSGGACICPSFMRLSAWQRGHHDLRRCRCVYLAFPSLVVCECSCCERYFLSTNGQFLRCRCRPPIVMGSTRPFQCLDLSISEEAPLSFSSLQPWPRP